MTLPDAPTHRGVVRTRDLWLDRALLGDDEARTRILAWWRPGSTLRALGPGWWLSLPTVVRVDTRTVGATVLVGAGARVTSAPGSAPAGVQLHRAGGWVGGPAETLPLVDPSTWLDDALPPFVTTQPLGEPPPVVVAAGALETDLRRRLGLSDVLGGLKDSLPGLPGAGLSDGLRSMLAGFLGRSAQLGNAIGGRSATVRSWMSRLESVASAMGLDALLTQAVGAHNARYLQQLLGMLEGGDWLEAVAHGIPLGGQGVGGSGGLAWLSALKGLQWSSGGGTGGGSVGAGPDLYARLVALYEKAHRALDEAGRTKEAAYVLAELLGKVGEAVEYLESKGEWQLAAELAESKGLDPGLQVALWIRAGDEDRAVAIAIVNEAFAVAVTHLERRRLHEAATGLRLRWAWREQRAGRVVAAVEIAWPVEEARNLVRAWLAAASRAGGPGGARALARSLSLRPEALAEDLASLERLLEDDTAAARRAFAAVVPTDVPIGRQAARATSRALLRDWARDGEAVDAEAARKAADACADGALAVDWAPTASARAPTWPPQRVHHPVGEFDTGAIPILDAWPLDRGRWLVAVGEAGTWVLDRDGRRIRELAAPSHRLVGARDGGQVLLVGQRPDRLRVHQLSLPDQRVTRWLDLKATAFAGETDGSVWFVAEGDCVDALDLHTSTPRSLWRVDGLAGRSGGRVLGLEVAAGNLWIVASGSAPVEVERFHYALPTLRLRERKPSVRGPGLTEFVPTAAGFASAGGRALEAVGAATSRVELMGPILQLAASGTLVGAATARAVELYEPDGLGFKPKAVVETTGATQSWSRFRTTPEGLATWVVGDDRGRLRIVDLRAGALLLDARVG